MRIVTSSRTGWVIVTLDCMVVLNRKRQVVSAIGALGRKLPTLNSGTPSTFKKWAAKTK